MTGYRVQIPPTTELHRRELELRVRQLRDLHRAMGMQEVWFETIDDVLAYLNDTCGVRTTYGTRIVRQTLKSWTKHRGFPLFTAPRSRRNTSAAVRIASSNVLVMAWLWAHRTFVESRRTQTPVDRTPDVAAL